MTKATQYARFHPPTGCAFSVRAPAPLKSLFALLTALLATLAVAGQPFEDALVEKLDAEGKQGTYQWLKASGELYRDDPRYYDWLSRFAMDQGDYRTAIPALERLIELMPNHMGARLDLVIALQLEGRSHEARNRLVELNTLLARGSEPLPPQASQQLEELNRLLIAPTEEPATPGLSTLLTLGVGHDSNANRGADSDTITVRIPGFPPFDLPLGRDSIKRGDAFAEAGAHLDYGVRGNGCRYEPCRLWLAGAMTRQYESLDAYNQRHLYLGTRKTYGGQQQREYTLLAHNIRSSEVRFEGLDKQIDEQYIVSLEYRQLLPIGRKLSGSLKGDIIEDVHNDESTGYMATVGLNGALSLWGSPSFSQHNRQLLWDASASWHNRPGYYAGDNQRLRLSANFPFAVAGQWQGNLGATYRWRKDEEPFSTIFFGNTVREDNEWVLSASLQRALGLRLHLTSRAHYEVVDSSIPLFDVNRLQVTLGLAYQL